MVSNPLGDVATRTTYNSALIECRIPVSVQPNLFLLPFSRINVQSILASIWRIASLRSPNASRCCGVPVPIPSVWESWYERESDESAGAYCCHLRLGPQLAAFRPKRYWESSCYRQTHRLDPFASIEESRLRPSFCLFQAPVARHSAHHNPDPFLVPGFGLHGYTPCSAWIGNRPILDVPLADETYCQSGARWNCHPLGCSACSVL